MKKLVSIPLSIITYLFALFFLYFFHVIQFVCFHVFGYEAHKRSVDVLGFFLIKILLINFTTAEAEFKTELPTGKPLIIAANHQGMYDIIGIGWFLRKYHPKYVSKMELGKWIPSISYNLNHGGSVLIDRKNPKQALPALKKMAEYIQTNNCSAVIYPEGTRSRDGRPGHFASNGLKILCKYAPDALVVPVTINNSWKVFGNHSFPLGIGVHLKFTVHPPLAVKDYDFNTLFEMTEKAIVGDIAQ